MKKLFTILIKTSRYSNSEDSLVKFNKTEEWEEAYEKAFLQKKSIPTEKKKKEMQKEAL